MIFSVFFEERPLSLLIFLALEYRIENKSLESANSCTKYSYILFVRIPQEQEYLETINTKVES